MCTNGRWIRNKYTGDRIFVNCGHCASCQQDKANRRSRRIKNEYCPDKIALFVTLTYDRLSCPYVRLDELISNYRNFNSSLPVNVYRHFTTRRKRCSDGKYRDRRSFKPVILDSVFCSFGSGVTGLSSLPFLKYRKHKKEVGVIRYADVQGFYARLRLNLKRN